MGLSTQVARKIDVWNVTDLHPCSKTCLYTARGVLEDEDCISCWHPIEKAGSMAKNLWIGLGFADLVPRYNVMHETKKFSMQTGLQVIVATMGGRCHSHRHAAPVKVSHQSRNSRHEGRFREKDLQPLLSLCEKVFSRDQIRQLQLVNANLASIKCLLAHHFGLQVPRELPIPPVEDLLLSHTVRAFRVQEQPIHVKDDMCHSRSLSTCQQHAQRLQGQTLHGVFRSLYTT
mmetsp:Transcript_1214/g.2766  ORF Transcript_1214/g.2766 Transcript_1214/m.2766 type:complete len:231 (-) Transcript_1214:563-1255(-)